MPTKSGSWFRQKERILKKNNHVTSFIVGYQWENQLNVLFACPGCVGLPCWALGRYQQLPDGKTTTHFLPFGQLWFRIHPPPVGVPHKALRNSGNTKKAVILCQALARQGHCEHKSICQGTKPSHTSLISIKSICNAAQMQMLIVAGQTTGLFGLRVFFNDLFNFKINFSLWNTY